MNCTHPKCRSTEEREQESQGLKQPAKVPWRAADPELNPEGCKDSSIFENQFNTPH